MTAGEQRDFEDALLEGRVKLPSVSFDALVAAVHAELAAGAPDAAWAIDGVAEAHELPANVEAALLAYFDLPIIDVALIAREREFPLTAVEEAIWQHCEAP